jgi:uncharacterized protein
VATWGPQAGDPLAVCRPLGVEVYRVEPELLHGWHPALVALYQGTHGMQLAEASGP